MRAIKMLVAALALTAAVAASAQPVQVIHPTNAVWRYLADGSDQGAAWQASAFDDSTWPQGQALFGNDTGYPYGFNTAIPGLAPITVYYRSTFNWAAGTFGVVLTGTNYVDDGSIIYLNGVEIARFNMPAGPAAFDTLAPAANPGGFPNVNGGEPVLVLLQIPLDSLTNGNANPLITGVNTIAVEVHQNAATSSDRVFGLALYGQQAVAPCTDGIQPTDRTIVERRSTTFTVVLPANCGVPTPSIQWYRNVGGGEELITGATATSYTLTNAQDILDEGVYYARLSNPSGTVDSRQAVLTINEDMTPPVFLSAFIVGPGLNTFRLTTDEELCIDPLGLTCAHDASSGFYWEIFQSDDLGVALGVATVTQINPTTYEFTTSFARDPAKQYRITAIDAGAGTTEISDLDGNLVAVNTYAESGLQLNFQQGDGNGYAGTHDAEVHSNAGADTTLGVTQPNTMGADLDDAGIAQSLIRFDNIFGSGATQIRPGSTIVSARLVFNQVDAGSEVRIHRMLVSFGDQLSVTWNLMNGGVTADDAEATVAFDSAKAAGLANGAVTFDVTASVQAWSAGQPNHGWVLLSQGTDGWDVNTADSGVGTAPRLEVDYVTVPCMGLPSITAQPPATISVNEGGTLTINATVANACGSLQWRKDGVDIPGANGSTYTKANVVAGAGGDGGSYTLRATNPDGSVTSSASVVTVVTDTTRPRVTRVASSANGTTITVQFNEAVTAVTAENTANYVLVPAVAVSSAVLSGGNTVTLTTAARSVGTAYSLRISGIRDATFGNNLLDPNPTVVALTTASVVAGAGFGGTWSYNSNNLDGVTWTTGALDATWGSGPAGFGIETGAGVIAAAPAPINTPLSANSVAPGDQLTTTYFRRDITLPALPAGASYVICHYTDDGHITYLDGVEINRFGMPAGAVTFTNRSTGVPNGGEASMRAFTFTATPGPHVLAVELHQAGTTSSDVWFDMEVRIVGNAAPTLSISRNTSPAGSLSLNWNGDANWQLRSSTTVNGLYNNVAIPAGTAQGTLLIPAATATTGNNFYKLDYICLP